MMNKRITRFMTGALVFSVLIVFLGCQAVFTFSPVSFLQRDPSKLSLDQKMTYAEDALAGGDRNVMLDAYNAIKDDATGSTDGELNLLAAKLAMELSGVPGLLNQVLSGDINFENTDTSQYQSLLDSLNTLYIGDASTYYQGADTNAADMNTSDYLLGAASILFAGTPGNDVGDSTTAEAASTFLEHGKEKFIGDPVWQVLDAFQSFIDEILVT